MKKKALNWGETPFDVLDREALLIQCKRMFIALQSLQHVADQHRMDSKEGYWAPGSVGGRSYAQGQQALAAAKQGFSEDNMHHAFFRYATPLLFTGEAVHGREWSVCAKCQTMLGQLYDTARQQKPPTEHYDQVGSVCDGTLRPIQWSDLDPQNAPPA